MNNFTPAELRKLRSLKTPHGIQRFLDDMPYHLADTAWSPRRVLEQNTAHCFEGATLAAAALRANGYPPLVFSTSKPNTTPITSSPSIASKAIGEPSPNPTTLDAATANPLPHSARASPQLLRRLFQPPPRAIPAHFLAPGQPLPLRPRDWMTTDQHLWFIADYLFTIRHHPLLRPGMAKHLHRLDDRSFRAGCLGRAEK